MFVGTDFKIRAMDITYHCEGVITPTFEHALPAKNGEGYTDCEGLTQLNDG